MSVIILICVAVSSVVFADALDDFMNKGMIFRRYKYWLTIITKRKGILPFLYKPLGGCFTCFCIWVYFFMGACFLFINPIWLFLFGIGLVNFLRKLMSRYELL